MILSQSEAEAIYSARRALNAVGGRLRITLCGDTEIYERMDGSLQILGDGAESYASQSAFAAAYGLEPVVHGELAVRADGEANRYTVIRDGNRWVAAVQLNGEFTVDRQKAIMDWFVAALR